MYAELHDIKEIGGKKIRQIRRLKFQAITDILGEVKQKISKAYEYTFKVLCMN